MGCRPHHNSTFQELDAFIEGADHGLILFCLGISTEMTDMIENDLRPLFTVFGELNQRVIAKGRNIILVYYKSILKGGENTLDTLNLFCKSLRADNIIS